MGTPFSSYFSDVIHNLVAILFVGPSPNVGQTAVV